jgi:hypothetical protein
LIEFWVVIAFEANRKYNEYSSYFK